MREDYLEILEKMFPDGYVIGYIMKNNDPAFSWYNPNQDEFIIAYLDLLQTALSEEDNEQNS